MNPYTARIMGELRGLMEHVELDREIFSGISTAPHIFVKGCGRTGLIMDMFAMRLSQMGFNAHVIGETTTPKARPGDLLLLGSGSGETESLTAIADKAKSAGVEIVLFTAKEKGTLQNTCDRMIVIKAPGKYDAKEGKTSGQPMGALFEQGLLIYLESLVLRQMEIFRVTEAEMREHHANLE